MPWVEEQNRMPLGLKVVLFALMIVALVGVFSNQCSVPDVRAQESLDWPEESARLRHDENMRMNLRRREVKALEEIAFSLKKIAVGMERK